MSDILKLRTDFKDDVFKGNRKYRKITNDDGTISLLDVTEYSQEGTSFDAETANLMGEAYNRVIATVPVDIGTVNIGANSLTHITASESVHPDYLFRYTYKNNRITEKTVVETFPNQTSRDLGILCEDNRSFDGGCYLYFSEQLTSTYVIPRITIRNVSDVKALAEYDASRANEIGKNVLVVQESADEVKTISTTVKTLADQTKVYAEQVADAMAGQLGIYVDDDGYISIIHGGKK